MRLSGAAHERTPAGVQRWWAVPVPITPLDELPEAQKLGDLVSIAADLDFAGAAAHRLLGMLDDDRSRGDDLQVRALFDAALIAYCRSFATGRRVALTEDWLDRDDAREAHAYFIGLRDQHVAHRISDFDRARVGVTLAIDTDPPPRVTGTAELLMRRTGETRQTVQSLLGLTRYIYGKVKVEMESARAELQAAAARMPIDDLYARVGPLGMMVPGPDSLRPQKRRRRRPRT